MMRGRNGSRVRTALILIGILVMGFTLGATATSVSDDFYKEIPLFTDSLSLIKSDYVDDVEVHRCLGFLYKEKDMSVESESEFDLYKKLKSTQP